MNTADRWSSWPELRRLPAYPLDSVRRAVVVAAHPGEEILGFGGSLALLAAHGVRLRLVTVSDDLGGLNADDADDAGPVAARALAVLGGTAVETVRLGVPGAAVRAHVPQIVRQLGLLLRGADICVAPWGGEQLADHREVRWAALLACALRLETALVEYPVRLSRWPAPQYAPVPWTRAARVRLPPEIARRKRRAVACVAPLLRPPLSGRSTGDDGFELLLR